MSDFAASMAALRQMATDAITPSTVTPAMRCAWREEFIHSSAEHTYLCESVNTLLDNLPKPWRTEDRQTLLQIIDRAEARMIRCNDALEWLNLHDSAWLDDYCDLLLKRMGEDNGNTPQSSLDIPLMVRRASGDRT